MDKVEVPKDLETGDYVLSFRWDCEQTPQIWNTCADVNPLKGGSIEGRHEVNLPRPVLQKMKKLLIMRDPSDSFFPEGKNSQDL